ncbi:MAG: hypothetical protein ACFWTS_02195 [Pseudoclavibacter caeni]|jgi:hypothetical protein
MSRSTAPTHVRARRSHTAAVVISALTVIAIGLAAGGVWLFVREQVPRLCDEATQQLSDAATSLDTVTDDAQTLYDDTVHTSGTPTVTPATSVPTADYPVSDGGSTLVSDLRQALRSPEVVDLTVTCDSRGDAASIRGRADEVNERADSLRASSPSDCGTAATPTGRARPWTPRSRSWTPPSRRSTTRTAPPTMPRARRAPRCSPTPKRSTTRCSSCWPPIPRRRRRMP